MRKDIHPKYGDAKIHCACGKVWETKSTIPVQKVGICSSCHPFFTGQQKLVDTAGRLKKFLDKYDKQKKVATSK